MFILMNFIWSMKQATKNSKIKLSVRKSPKEDWYAENKSRQKCKIQFGVLGVRIPANHAIHHRESKTYASKKFVKE